MSEKAHEQFAKRLREFLAGEWIAHFAVRDTRFLAQTIPIQSVDVCLAEFAADGRLLQLTPVLDPEFEPTLDSEQREEVHRSLVEVSNTTLAFDVTVRTGKILRHISRGYSASATAYALRILQSCFVTFEKNTNRFLPPAPTVFRFPGTGMFNFIVRKRPEGRADIWMQGQHTALDGIEFGQLFKRLEENFGGCEETLFPAPGGGARYSLPCHRAGDRELVTVGDFFDFAPLRQLKRRLNRQSSVRLPVPVTEATLLLWTLGNQPEFSGETFALVVDVPPKGGHPRRLDFIVIRPWEFFDSAAPLDGFPHFLTAYTDRLRLVQSDRSRPYRSIKNVAMLPPFLAQKVMQMNMRARQRGLGTITISLLKSVTVSLAPITNLASDRATFVFGNMLLPCENRGRVGWVTMKGAPASISRYPDALQRAIHQFPGSLHNIS